MEQLRVVGSVGRSWEKPTGWVKIWKSADPDAGGQGVSVRPSRHVKLRSSYTKRYNLSQGEGCRRGSSPVLIRKGIL